MDRNEMIDILTKNVVNVTFTKTDGTKRVLKATLKSDVTPETKHLRQASDEVVPVWDLENKGWRSFRVDSVTDFTPV